MKEETIAYKVYFEFHFEVEYANKEKNGCHGISVYFMLILN